MLIKHLWQLKTVVFLHRYLLHAVLLVCLYEHKGQAPTLSFVHEIHMLENWQGRVKYLPQRDKQTDIFSL